MPSNTVGDALSDRILDAAVRCAGRWGVSKTTVDDVAREASCSRASIYRTFAGGKDDLLAAAGARELARFFERLGERLDATDSLDAMLTAAVADAARWIRDHEVFQYLLAHEPEVVLPHIAFHRLDDLFRVVTAYAVPHLSRFVAPTEAARLAEWVTRLVVSYTLLPSADVDLAREDDARTIVALVLPGVSCLDQAPSRSAVSAGS